MPHPLPDPELRAWLAWLRAPGVGSVRLRAAIARAGSACAALQGGASLWRACNIPPAADAALRSPDTARIDADLRWLAQEDHHFLQYTGEDFPPLLARIGDAPAALFVAGDPILLWMPQLAIVGARNATAGGLATARDFSATLARAGFTITSGLAVGIDAAAHEAALQSGGKTVAVCGTGLERIYPQANAGLAATIARQGALVSEYPLDTPVRADQFPRRNRVIAGLALGTLVIEAGLRSGSLITARLAGEQGREVFAIPGSIHNPLARGCHRLIRQGAKLVESAQDVLDELGPLARELGAALALRLDAPAPPRARAPPPARCDDPEYRRLLDALAYDPVNVDELVARSGLTAPQVSSMLLLLELDGVVAAQAGARYALVPVR